MESVSLLKVFIASPGDVLKQRNEVELIINKWNIENTDSKKVVLMPVRWEDNSVPTYKENQSGQMILNKQIVGKSDILIAIFGSKLGSRVDGYESGTIAEIDYFSKEVSDKIGVFFIKENIDPRMYTEYVRVDEYRKSLSDDKKGLYREYDPEIVRRFLTVKVQEILDEKKKDLDSVVNVRSDNSYSGFSESLNTSKFSDYDASEGQKFFSNFFDPIEFDNDERLLMIYAVEDETAVFPTSNYFQESVLDWEKERKIKPYLSNRVFNVLEKLEKCGILEADSYSDFNEYPDSYSLKKENYKRLKQIILHNTEKVEKVIANFKISELRDPFPVNKKTSETEKRFVEDDLPF